MKIKIYQVNLERDADGVAFMNLDFTAKHQHSLAINSPIYDKVFEGEVTCKSLEDVFTMFNIRHPTGYKARSLSVSDVVEIVESDTVNKGFYFCDSYGFQPVSFEPDKAQISDRFCDADKVDKITVLFVRAGETPELIEIENNLEAMQELVGGDIEQYMPYEDEVALVCNDEGKMNGMALNRAIYSEPQQVEMTYAELTKLFRETERTGGKHLTARIIFTEDSFDKPYSEESRTYEFSSNNKAFKPNMGGYSIFGYCLDGQDSNARLEALMQVEHGGKDGWKIEKCFLMDEGHEMMDIICGDFFIAYAPIESEKYLSLPRHLVGKYKEMFKYPETFVRTDEGIKAIPVRLPHKDKER